MNETIHERIQTIVKEFGNGKNTEIANTIGVSEANIRGYIKGVMPKGDVLEKIVRNYDISPLWLLTGEGSMLNDNMHKSIEHSISNIPDLGAPYYDVDFIGGFDEVFNCQITVPQNYIKIQGFEKADCWCNVSGHSMEPVINHGDIIALKKCYVEDIQYGEIYAVVMNSVHTIKILRKSSKQDMLRFIPINTKDFDEKEYPISDILHIYKVIGSVRKFF